MLGKLGGASNDGLPEAQREGWGRGAGAKLAAASLPHKWLHHRQAQVNTPSWRSRIDALELACWAR